jgi:type II secretory pathway predicted ATPase ExeA
MADNIFSILGLSSNPFSCTASTKDYFHTSRTKAILDELIYGIRHRKGFMVLVGEVGVGKTSLLYQLLAMLEEDNLSTAWLFNTMLDRKDLLMAIARDFGLKPDNNINLAELLDMLHHFFLEQYSKNYNCAIIIDEAHNLEPSTLEALRMLSNLETEGQKLVQILLVGQPELQEKLDQPNLRQLRSRINIYLELTPLQKEEIPRYVNFKLASAGGEISVSKAAFNLLWDAAHGNMRMVNLVMERALYAMLALGQDKLSGKIMNAAVKEIASYQGNVAQNLKQKRNKMLLAAATPLIFLLIFSFFHFPVFSQAGQKIAGYMSHLFVDTTTTTAQKQETKKPDKKETVQKAKPVKTHQPPEGRKIASQQSTKQAPAQSQPDKKNVEMAKTPSPPSYPDIYLQFLKPFGLENLVRDFDRAIKTKNIYLFRESLPQNFQLLMLDTLPWQGGVKYVAFNWKQYTKKNPEWIVIWQPKIVIKKFYSSYKSDQVAMLQEMLQSLGFYRPPIDGRVGPITWRAISRFQKVYNLPRSGVPDPETVFWVYTTYIHTVMDSQKSKRRQ